MGNNWKGQPASRLGRSIVTNVTGNMATQSTTGFSAQTYQVRVVHTLNGSAGIWATIGSTATDVTANSSAVLLPAGVPEYFAVTAGQHFNFLSTSTSTGYVTVTEIV